MKKVFYTILPIIIATIGAASCGNNGCEEIRESYCFADLLSTSGAKINQLYAYGLGQYETVIGEDTVLVDREMLSLSSPKNLEFILNPDSTVTDIRLQMNITLDGDQFQYNDTLHIEYNSHPYFLDMECGCSMYFTLKEVTYTNNFLRSVTIKRNEITNEENINLIIEY